MELAFLNNNNRWYFSTLPMVFIFFFLISGAFRGSSSLGINYGQVGNNLPPPSTAIALIRSTGATRVKLYDTDPRVLKSFANTNLQLIVSLPNECLAQMCDAARALDWVKKNVQAYLPSTKITTVAVGNEVLTLNDTALSDSLVPAMESIHTALVQLNLHNQVQVTTAHNLMILETSYPPSSGAFRKDLTKKLACVLDFHCKVGSPFLINAYPYFAYRSNPKQVSLEFALFEGSGITDPANGLHYENMFHAQIDATYSAMERMGYKNVSLQVSETGWPSKGDSDEAGASPENAKKYNANLLRMISEKKGTPLRPNADLNVHVFALFNENKKPGPTSERNFGLFKPDGTPVYDLGFNVTGLGGSNGGGGGGGGGGGAATPTVLSPVVGSSSDGYLSITADDAAERLPLHRLLIIMCLFASLVALQV